MDGAPSIGKELFKIEDNGALFPGRQVAVRLSKVDALSKSLTFPSHVNVGATGGPSPRLRMESVLRSRTMKSAHVSA